MKLTALLINGESALYKCDKCGHGLMPELGVVPRQLYLVSDGSCICTKCQSKAAVKQGRIDRLAEARAKKVSE